jgi:hypothetical protein
VLAEKLKRALGDACIDSSVILRLMPGVFLSYARTDGEGRAAELRDRLGRDAPDIVINRTAFFWKAARGGGNRSPRPSIRWSSSSS